MNRGMRRLKMNNKLINLLNLNCQTCHKHMNFHTKSSFEQHYTHLFTEIELKLAMS